VNLIILSRIYFYAFWFLALALTLAFESTIWPFIFGSLPSPNLFLNNLILLTLFAKKPSPVAFALAAFVYSSGSSFGFGYYLSAFYVLYLALLFIRSQTFFLDEKNLFWVVIGSHVLVYLTQEIIFTYWASKPWHFPFFDLTLKVSLSALCFPIHRHFFRNLLSAWRNSKWGEVGNE
jgi:hypothetical protein